MKKSLTLSRKPIGFTLVELLVVISIIAVLLAVLLPGLKAARESGKKVVCSTHLHQMGVGITMYLDSNNQIYPFGFGKDFYKDRWYRMYSWADPNGDLTYCPSQDKAWECGYAYNLNFGYRWGKYYSPVNSGPRFDGVKYLNVRIPSEKVIITDSSLAYHMSLLAGRTPENSAKYYSCSFQFNRDPGIDYNASKTEIIIYFSIEGVGIHRGAINYLYADGHAGSMKGEGEPRKFWPYVKGSK